MDRRTEPRFQVSSPAKIFPLDHPERELRGSLLNVSASGLLLLVDEDLTVGTLIAVEVEHHLILGEVQNARTRGSRFAIGTKRLRALDKLDLRPDATMAENIQLLRNEFGAPALEAEAPALPEPATPAAEVAVEPRPDVSAPETLPSIPASLTLVLPKLPSPSAEQFAAIQKAETRE